MMAFWIISILILASGIYFYSNSSFDSNYLELPPMPEFSGNLKLNYGLQDATYLAHKMIRGPETLEITHDGIIYTGLANGQIVSIDTKSANVKKIAQIGPEARPEICNDEHQSHQECGRPLGIRLRNNILYIADAYYGLMKVNLTTGEKTTILSSNDARFGYRPLKFTNDLDLDGDVIYFLDTTYSRNVNEFLEEHIEAQPRGRLFSFNEKTNELKLLKENLFFPNGIQLTPDNAALLINENTQARILKYHINGPQQGKTEIFANLPGFSDTIRMTDRQTLLVPFAVVRCSIFYSFLDLLGKLPLVRNMILSTMNTEFLFGTAPKYGLLAEYDLNGQILKTWHDPSGKFIETISSAAIHDGKIYLGSLYIDYIGIVDY